MNDFVLFQDVCTEEKQSLSKIYKVKLFVLLSRKQRVFAKASHKQLYWF